MIKPEPMKLPKVPSSLLRKSHILGTVIFTILFALIFLNLYIPFSQTAWFGLGGSDTFWRTIIFIAIAISILIGNRVGMHLLNKRKAITFSVYTLWCVIEIVLICGIYTATSSEISTGLSRTKSEIFWHALPYCAIALGMPCIIATMYFIILDKNNIIKLMSSDNIVTDEVSPDGGHQTKITLCDNNGTVKMLVSIENLYYIQSDDNYIKVCYTDSQGQMQRYMLRCSLRTIEENFKDIGLIRCSRQYIVNAAKVGHIRKEYGGYILELTNQSIQPITVTKNYADKVLLYFRTSRHIAEEGDE